MSALVAIYALVAAIIFGWLLNDRLSARPRPSVGPPWSMILLLPLFWPLALAWLAIALVCAALTPLWTGRGGW